MKNGIELSVIIEKVQYPDTHWSDEAGGFGVRCPDDAAGLLLQLVHIRGVDIRARL